MAMDIVQRLRCVLKGNSDAQAAADEILKLRSALAELEGANDALCAKRTEEQYRLMLAIGQQDELLRLDNARFAARNLLKTPNVADNRTPRADGSEHGAPLPGGPR